jgi:hypothetical protein
MNFKLTNEKLSKDLPGSNKVSKNSSGSNKLSKDKIRIPKLSKDSPGSKSLKSSKRRGPTIRIAPGLLGT